MPNKETNSLLLYINQLKGVRSKPSTYLKSRWLDWKPSNVLNHAYNTLCERWLLNWLIIASWNGLPTLLDGIAIFTFLGVMKYDNQLHLIKNLYLKLPVPLWRDLLYTFSPIWDEDTFSLKLNIRQDYDNQDWQIWWVIKSHESRALSCLRP